MRFKTAPSVRHSVQAGIKLARLLELSEEDFASRIRELEANEFFKTLLDFKVVSVTPFGNTRFASRYFARWGVSTASDGIPALDERGDLALLLKKVGQTCFEEYFLQEGRLTDIDRARLCEITVKEAARLRDLVNSLYVQAEFDGSAGNATPSKTYSTVAGVMLEGGKPALAFFNREIWKGRYRIDEDKQRQLLDLMPAAEAKRMERLLRDLELLEKRKTTLYRLLEFLLESQAKFFISGDPDKRLPLTQKSVSEKMDVLPSVLNRLISNKSIELPWGLEAPLKTLFPSRKSMLRDCLLDLIREYPSSTDQELCALIDRMYGAKLSCRSIAQYRADLGVGNRRTRVGWQLIQ